MRSQAFAAGYPECSCAFVSKTQLHPVFLGELGNGCSLPCAYGGTSAIVVMFTWPRVSSSLVASAKATLKRVGARNTPSVAAAAMLGIGMSVGALPGQAAPAPTTPYGFSIAGTGQATTTVGGFTTDNNWKLIAMPDYVCSGDCAGLDVLAPTAAAPASVYISGVVPGPWNNDVSGVNGKTITRNGVSQVFKWITYSEYPNNYGATSTDPSGNFSQSYFNRAPASQLSIATAQAGVPFSGNYSYIMGTQFNVTKAGKYSFNFNASADNQFQFYLAQGALSNVSVSKSGGFSAQQPGVVGATLLAENAANTSGQFGTIFNETSAGVLKASEVNLSQGDYSLLFRITDNWVLGGGSVWTYGSSGGFIGASFFAEVNEVPAPLPILGAGAAFATSRRLRRRIRRSRTLVSSAQ